MTTSRRLWLGFGLLILMQMAMVVGIGLWLRAMQDDFSVIAAAKQQTDPQRQDALFTEYSALSDALIAQRDLQPPADPAALQRFVELRGELGRILNTEVQRHAQQEMARAQRGVQHSLDLMTLAVLGLLIFVPLLSVVLSVHVGRRIIRAERTLSVTLRSIGDGVITTDARGRITALTRVAEQLTGWNEKAALGQPVERIFRIVDEITRQPAPNPATRALAEGIVSGLANHTVLVAKDGAEHAIEDSAAPIRDQQGNLVGCALIFRDVTEQRRATRQLQENEQRFRALFESGPVAVFSCDRNGILLDYNTRAAELWGRKPERGSSDERYFAALKLLRPDGVLMTPVENPLVAALQKGESVRDLETQHEGPKGACAVLMNFSPLKTAGGEVTGGIGAFYDISERRHIEDVLRQTAADMSEADQKKNEFLALLAHELRNPLATISNAAQILVMAKASPEAHRSTTQMMERQIGHMSRLVDDLLDVSRISRGKIELRRDRIDLLGVIRHTVDAVRPEYVAKGVELAVTLPPEPVTVDGDSTRLQQAIGNLLNNARKFTATGGRVWLIVEAPATPGQGEVVIRVQDNGSGIAPDQLPKIFGLFVQSDTTLARTSDGLGIGLALVKALIEMHGGSVSARSDGPGRGSEFTVRLPVLSGAPALADTLPRPEVTPTPPGVKTARRILVVDDNRASAQSLALLLKLGNHEVHCAHDGLEAVAMAQSVQPEVVLLDIGLPKLNGYEVAQKIRAEKWGRRMVLIALTGWGQKSDKRRAGESGFNHYMVKPLRHAELTALLDGLPAPKAPPA